MADHDILEKCRDAWNRRDSPEPASDYALLEKVGGGFLARGRDGSATLVFQIADTDGGRVGRRSGGTELLAHRVTRFHFEGETWEGSAAALRCTNPELVDTFAVLASDVVGRLSTQPSWPDIAALVDQWQTLLVPRGRPSRKRELGLWGELWFVNAARDPEALLAAWRGPEGDASDFFLGGVAVEVKTSRLLRRHHVSQSQVPTPVGDYSAWLLSLWTKQDPRSGVTVATLVDNLVGRARDPAEVLKTLARAGYSATDRGEYDSRYLLLEEPEWYPLETVPRVKSADAGVSHLRYQVVLDESRKGQSAVAHRQWNHFHGWAYGSREE